MHGGPLRVPMCYAQIGGLTVATFVTLVLVPVIYAIFVKDLKLVKWETAETHISHDVPRVNANGAHTTVRLNPSRFAIRTGIR